MATELPAPGFWDGDDPAHIHGGFEWGLAEALADGLGLRLAVREVPFADIVAGLEEPEQSVLIEYTYRERVAIVTLNRLTQEGTTA